MAKINVSIIKEIKEEDRCYVPVHVASKVYGVSAQGLYRRVYRKTIPHKEVFVKQIRIPVKKENLTLDQIEKYNDYTEKM